MRFGRKYLNLYDGEFTRRTQGIVTVIVAIVLIVFALIFSSCKTVAPIVGGTHESSHDSIHTEYRIDTVYKDRWHTEYMRGDTLYIHDSIDRWRVREVIIRDSIDNSRIDTIYQTVEVEKKGAAFWRGSGIAFWVLIGMLVLGVAIGLVIKFAK